MAKKTKTEEARHLRDEVYSLWNARPPEQRTTSDLNEFIDGLWSQGIRCGHASHTHWQEAMDIVRLHVHS